MDSSNNKLEKIENYISSIVQKNILLDLLVSSGSVNLENLKYIAAQNKISVETVGTVLLTRRLNDAKSNLSFAVEVIRVIREAKKLPPLPVKEVKQLLKNTCTDDLPEMFERLQNEQSLPENGEKNSFDKIIESLVSRISLIEQGSIEEQTLDNCGITDIISELEHFQKQRIYDDFSREQLVKKLTDLMQKSHKKIDAIPLSSSGSTFEKLNQDVEEMKIFLGQLQLFLKILKP